MNKPAAFRASFSDLKLVKTRQIAQLIFEIPLAEFDAAYDVLGGLPNPASEQWFAIAPLDLTKKHIDAKPQREWRDIQPSQQAGIRSSEPCFIAFLKEMHPDDWHESQDAAACVRLICGVASRSELVTNQKARVIWHQLDSEYQAWLMLERVS
jgi:hypothetical protein